jgi:hypothetical protein
VKRAAHLLLCLHVLLLSAAEYQKLDFPMDNAQHRQDTVQCNPLATMLLSANMLLYVVCCCLLQGTRSWAV